MTAKLTKAHRTAIAGAMPRGRMTTACRIAAAMRQVRGRLCRPGLAACGGRQLGTVALH